MSKWRQSTAFVLREMIIVVAIIAIIAAIAIPNLLRARASANESSAISSLRTLVSSQAMFYQGDIEDDGIYDYATSLEELEEEQLIDYLLASGEKSGYLFDMTTDEDRQGWAATAVPDTESSGRRTFYVDEEGEIKPGHCGNGIVEPSEQCELVSGRDCGPGKICLPRSCQCAE